MTPVQAAIQLSRVWRESWCPDGQIYPVKCDQIAQGLGIKVHGDESLGSDFEAALFITPHGNRIIFNDGIPEPGRKNFSVGHELGHFSLHKDIKEFRCSFSALADMAPHPQNIEQEANLFAANLLMPADDFREQLQLRPLTMATVAALAKRYDTSLTATGYRLIDVSARTPLAMVRTRGNRVHRWTRTKEMQWAGFWLREGQALPAPVLAPDDDGYEVESDLWLNEKNAPRWTLTQSTIYKSSYDETQILIRAEKTGEHRDSDFDDEPDPTPPSIPNFN